MYEKYQDMLTREIILLDNETLTLEVLLRDNLD